MYKYPSKPIRNNPIPNKVPWTNNAMLISLSPMIHTAIFLSCDAPSSYKFQGRSYRNKLRGKSSIDGL
jgi:hypothetical protein